MSIINLFENTLNYAKNIENTNNLNDEIILNKQGVLKNIHQYNYKYYKNIFTNTLCDYIINESEKFANNNKSQTNLTGWTQTRHKKYPTTDLPIKEIPHLFSILNNVIRDKVFPIIENEYDVYKYFLDFNDLFIVKYDATKQANLNKHVDGCAFSFNILLNKSSNFEGGGTIIYDTNNNKTLVHNTKGGLVLHSGQCFHEGNAITSGIRYILVGFISYIKHFNNAIDNNVNNAIDNNVNNAIDNNVNNAIDNLQLWKIDNSNLKSNTELHVFINCNIAPILLDTTKLKFNLLEKYVFDMALFHFDRLGIKYDNTMCFIEYWYKVENVTKQNGNTHVLHTDKDEFLYKNTNTLKHPLLSTVTYVTDSNVFTLLTNIKQYNNKLNNNKNFILSSTKKMNHIAFDPSFLHGAVNINSIDNNNKNERKTLMFNLWHNYKPSNINYNIDNTNNNYDKNNNIIMNKINYDKKDYTTHIEKNTMNNIMNNFKTLCPKKNINIIETYLKNNENKDLFYFDVL